MSRPGNRNKIVHNSATTKMSSFVKQSSLERKTLVSIESSLLQVGDASKVDHGGWATHEDYPVRTGLEQVRGDHLLGYEPGTVGPF